MLTHADLDTLSDRITAALEREITLARNESAKDFARLDRQITELGERLSEQAAQITSHDEIFARLDCTGRLRRLEAIEALAREHLLAHASRDRRATDPPGWQWLPRTLSRKQMSAVVGGLIAAGAALVEVLRALLDWVSAGHPGVP